MRRPMVFGLENEYGVHAVGYERRVFSRHNALVGSRLRRTPAQDIFESVVGALLDEVGIAAGGWHKASSHRAFLPNGGLIYRDTGSHPEYATPECLTPDVLVAHDRAGDRSFTEAVVALLQSTSFRRSFPQVDELHVYKNNFDSGRNAYGTHENYLIERTLAAPQLEAEFLPFLSTRPLIAGSGGIVASVDDPRGYRFVLSPRAEVIHGEFGNQTTRDRPMLNLKNEALADADRYRRAHLLCGDATRCEISTLLKVGSTAIVLAMVEDGFWSDYRGHGERVGVPLASAFRALRQVSGDLTGTEPLARADGSSIRALDIQWQYLAAAQEYAAETGLARCGGESAKAVLTQWERALLAIEAQDLGALFGVLDWPTRYMILDRDAERRAGQPPEDIHIAACALDLSYAELHPDALFEKLTAHGKIEHIATGAPTLRDPAPSDTRATIRSAAVRHWPHAIQKMSWETVTVDHERGPITIDLSEPVLTDAVEVAGIDQYRGLPFLRALALASPNRLVELARCNTNIYVLDTLYRETQLLISERGDDPHGQEALIEIGRSAIAGLREEARNTRNTRDTRVEMYLALSERAFHAAGVPDLLRAVLRSTAEEIRSEQRALESARTRLTAMFRQPSGEDSAVTEWRRGEHALATFARLIDAIERRDQQDPHERSEPKSIDR